MKIHILSDLHNEFSQFKPPQTDADVVVLAGDIDGGIEGVRWAKQTFLKPVVYVAGNHEFYRGEMRGDIQHLRDFTNNSHVHFLERNVAELCGVRFIGTTLWTDFKLDSYGKKGMNRAMENAQLHMNDFSLIQLDKKRFQPRDAVEIFRQSSQFIADALAVPFAGKTVVVTHHGPSPKSVHPRYASNPLNAAFCSDLEYLMQRDKAPALWIHGHTHDSFDYQVGTTRVVANPRGYTRRFTPNEQENHLFNPGLIIDI